MRNQRGGERVEMLGRVTGDVSVYQPMAILELSARGVAVETTFPLHLESLHQLRLTLGTRSIIVRGRVVHSRISDLDPATYCSGLEFVELPAHAETTIANFLQAVKTSRDDV